MVLFSSTASYSLGGTLSAEEGFSTSAEPQPKTDRSTMFLLAAVVLGPSLVAALPLWVLCGQYQTGGAFLDPWVAALPLWVHLWFSILAIALTRGFGWAGHSSTLAADFGPRV
jgi:hypothetical protein